MARQSSPDIRAAGGVVWRVHGGVVQIAMAHRPRYDDWSLPKGKLERGESELTAARREVREEIGADVVVSRMLGSVGYQVRDANRGVHKRTTYWAMRHTAGEFRANDEVDAVDWLEPKAARERMTYPLERQIVAEFEALPLPDSVLVLVRHAKAGKRSEWSGPDRLRPLDESGRAQALRLVAFLRAFAPDRVVSAEPVRCVDTVRPFADESGLEVTVEPAFGDAAFETKPEDAELALMSLAKPGRVAVVSSQGTAIPGLVDRVVGGVRPTDTKKGAAWVLSIVDGSAVSADYYPHASR